MQEEKATSKYRKNNLPEKIKNLSTELQEQWLGIYKAMLSQNKTEDESEKMATHSVQKVLQDSLESLFYMNEFVLKENNKLEIMRVGKWDHPLYGAFEITEQDIKDFVKTFEDNVRGVDLCIDLEHGETDKKGAAAGWIKSLEESEDGKSLLGEIDWTDLGKEVIEKEEYKYFSPEFKFSYKDNETGKTFKNVLFGGGLTNRPFIKNMQPVLLSENITVKEREEKGMNKKLLDILKLSETATEEEIKEAVNKLVESNTSLEIKLTEKDKELVKLTEENTTLKAEKEALKSNKTTLEQKVINLDESIKEVTIKLDNAEWDKISTKALEEGRLTPAILENYKALYFKDKETAINLIKDMPILIDLSEKGTKKGKTEDEKDPIELFEKEVSKIMLEEKKSYVEALVLAEKRHVKLFEDVEKVRFS